jgi:hypothetical protein
MNWIVLAVVISPPIIYAQGFAWFYVLGAVVAGALAGMLAEGEEIKHSGPGINRLVVLTWTIFYPIWIWGFVLIGRAFETGGRDSGDGWWFIAWACLLIVVIFVREQLSWIIWRARTLRRIRRSDDADDLRREFLESRYMADYLRKAAYKRIEQLENQGMSLGPSDPQ